MESSSGRSAADATLALGELEDGDTAALPALDRDVTSSVVLPLETSEDAASFEDIVIDSVLL